MSIFGLYNDDTYAGGAVEEDFLAVFGAEAEPDEVDYDLDDLDALLDEDIAEAEAEEEFGAANPYFPGSSAYGGAYGRVAFQPRPGNHPVAINETYLADGFMWPPAIASIADYIPNYVPGTNIEIDKFRAEAADIATQFKDMVGEGAGAGTGLPGDRAGQIEVLREVVEGAAFGEHLDWKDILVQKYQEGDGFFDTLRSMASGTPQMFIAWITDDLPNIIASMLPAGTESQMINGQAILIFLADLAGIQVYEQILDNLLATNAIKLSPSIYPYPDAVPPAAEPISAVDWSVQDVAPPPQTGLQLPEPKYILAAGYAAMVAKPLWDAVQKAWR